MQEKKEVAVNRRRLPVFNNMAFDRGLRHVDDLRWTYVSGALGQRGRGLPDKMLEHFNPQSGDIVDQKLLGARDMLAGDGPWGLLMGAASPSRNGRRMCSRRNWRSSQPKKLRPVAACEVPSFHAPLLCRIAR